MRSCSNHGICGIRGTCACSQGWTGWACGKLLGAFGLATLSSLDGSFVGSQVGVALHIAGRQPCFCVRVLYGSKKRVGRIVCLPPASPPLAARVLQLLSLGVSSKELPACIIDAQRTTPLFRQGEASLVADLASDLRACGACIAAQQVALPAGWSPAPTLMRNGLGAQGGSGASISALEAMQRLIDGSAPFPSALPEAAQMRFSKDSNSLQVRLGPKAGSGVFYVWHPADEGPVQTRLEASHSPAFLDVTCTQGAIRGHFKGLVFSSNKVPCSPRHEPCPVIYPDAHLASSLPLPPHLRPLGAPLGQSLLL